MLRARLDPRTEARMEDRPFRKQPYAPTVGRRRWVGSGYANTCLVHEDKKSLKKPEAVMWLLAYS